MNKIKTLVIGAFLILCAPFFSFAAEFSGKEIPVKGASSQSKEHLKAWFYDKTAGIYTYILWRDEGFYEILKTRQGGEEIGRKKIPSEKNAALELLIDDADRATYGGVTEGHSWEAFPETQKLKEAVDSV